MEHKVYTVIFSSCGKGTKNKHSHTCLFLFRGKGIAGMGETLN
jgi:hypothetical protein